MNIFPFSVLAASAHYDFMNVKPQKVFIQQLPRIHKIITPQSSLNCERKAQM